MLDPNHEKIQKICEFRPVPSRNYFIQINQNNQYYCVVQTPILLSEHCQNEPIFTTSITQNGILNLKPGCSIVTNEMKITSFTILKSKSEIVTPVFHLPQIKENIIKIVANTSHILNQNYSIITLTDFDNEFADISEKITDNLQKTQELSLLNDAVNEKINEVWLIVCAISLILTLVYILYKKFL